MFDRSMCKSCVFSHKLYTSLMLLSTLNFSKLIAKISEGRIQMLRSGEKISKFISSDISLVVNFRKFHSQSWIEKIGIIAAQEKKGKRSHFESQLHNKSLVKCVRHSRDHEQMSVLTLCQCVHFSSLFTFNTFRTQNSTMTTIVNSLRSSSGQALT